MPEMVRILLVKVWNFKLFRGVAHAFLIHDRQVMAQRANSIPTLPIRDPDGDRIVRAGLFVATLSTSPRCMDAADRLAHIIRIRLMRVNEVDQVHIPIGQNLRLELAQ